MRQFFADNARLVERLLTVSHFLLSQSFADEVHFCRVRFAEVSVVERLSVPVWLW